MSDKRLLTDEEAEIAVNKWKNEDWAVRYIRLNRGHYEDILPIIAKAQDAKTAEIVRKEILGELERGCNHWDRDWHNFAICSECVQALKEGRMPDAKV